MRANEQVDSFNKTMRLVWNVTTEALKHNSTTEVFAPIQGFFQAPAVGWLTIATDAPKDSRMKCEYIEPTKNQFIMCTVTAKGVHRLDVQRTPGIPNKVDRNPFLTVRS